MSWLDLEKLLTSGTKSDCKDLVYRGYSKQFKTKSGFAQKIELRFLKRKSCRGCLDCIGLSETIAMHLECDLDFLGFDKVQPDKFYTLKVINEKRDWETSAVEDYDIEIQEVKF